MWTLATDYKGRGSEVIRTMGEESKAQLLCFRHTCKGHWWRIGENVPSCGETPKPHCHRTARRPGTCADPPSVGAQCTSCTPVPCGLAALASQNCLLYLVHGRPSPAKLPPGRSCAFSKS